MTDNPLLTDPLFDHVTLFSNKRCPPFPRFVGQGQAFDRSLGMQESATIKQYSGNFMPGKISIIK
jgi:hypothetical protein